MNQELRRELLELRDRDQTKRQDLVERGELFTGYHPEMEQVHEDNTRALERILDRQGWPNVSEVGEDGAEAAWMVAAHAIGKPAFQRRSLELLQLAADAGEARPALGAALTDRIRVNERKPQVYGTLLDWDECGRMSPWPIEEPENVAERKRAVVLPPLEESVREARERAEREGARAPKSYDERQAQIAAWAKRVGWDDR